MAFQFRPHVLVVDDDASVREALTAALDDESGSVKLAATLSLAKLGVTDAADRILADLLSEAPLSRLARGAPPAETPPLFGAEEHPVLKALRKIDVNRTAPLDALARLAQWKAQLGA